MNHITFFSVHPNPVMDNMTIHFNLEKSMNLRIEIVNPTGKTKGVICDKFLEKGLHTITYNNVKILAPGIFFISLKTKETKIHYKIMKY